MRRLVTILPLSGSFIIPAGNAMHSRGLAKTMGDIAIGKNVEDMTQEELDQNWERARAQLALMTPDEHAKFVDQGGVMFGLIERLVAEGVDLRTWVPATE